MQCMKCGREIPAGDVFCEGCLTDMAKYPVKPGTVVTLPAQPKPQPVKKQLFHRPTLTLEERVKIMKKQLRVLSWTLTLTVALLVGVSALAISMLQEDQDEPLPGQNYSAEGEEKSTDEWYIDRFNNTQADSEESTEDEEGRENVNNRIEEKE